MVFCDEKKAAAFSTCPGSPIHDLYSPVVSKSGDVELKVCGQENTDEFIQSFKESTDISFILAKLAAGDDSVLRQRVGSYGDFLGAPKTYAEALQLQIDAGRAFDRLDPKVKAQFNNDANQFLAQAGTDRWFDILGLEVPGSVPEPVVDDVKEGAVVEP